ncbi:MAG TPA: guanylate kinase [Campylobacteraceae bacterium]|jgi:guanylate kinase|nr:guanylate kinase [Campylobacteraceae bacterium]HHD83562.1 guanylate kinase [Campylobacteraceae bacterium]
MGGKIVVVSGPSGCGKSSLTNEILKSEPDIYFSISTTTREIRPGEKEGVNYHYISKAQFEKEIEEGAFLEWAEVHGNYYGTSLKPIYKAIEEGKLVLLDIDVQGHAIVREKFPRILTSIFLTTPSQAELRRRLEHRGTDSADVIETRLHNARIEMARMDEYEYLLINDDFDTTLSDFRCLIHVARLKQSQSEINTFIREW